MEKVPNQVLLNTGLDLMKLNGKPLVKMQSKGRAMLYRLNNGQTVRARTCNDHILIAVADQPSPDAKLNIEGTDWLLVVMPVELRTAGEIIAYLIPTGIAVQEVRRTHREWLASNPRTKGSNTTWNLWFDEEGPEKACGYAKKWAQYRLLGQAETSHETPRQRNEQPASSVSPVKAEVDAARIRIARVAGVPIEAVRISIDFGA